MDENETRTAPRLSLYYRCYTYGLTGVARGTDDKSSVRWPSPLRTLLHSYSVELLRFKSPRTSRFRLDPQRAEVALYEPHTQRPLHIS